MKKVIISGLVAICLGFEACSSSRAESKLENFITSVSSSDKVIVASNKYVSKQISVSNFNAIESFGSYVVEYKHGTKPHVEVYLPDNVLSYMDIHVENKQLIIKSKDHVNIRWGNNSKAQITVYAPSVRYFTLLGSGDLFTNESLAGEDSYKFKLLGSGDLRVGSVKAATNITANLTGSGGLAIQDIETTGGDGNVNLMIAGSGDLNVNQVKSESLGASVSGSGDLNVAGISARNTAGSVAGSGDMQLIGTTDSAALSVSGSGNLSAGKLKAKDVNASASGSGEVTCYATGETHFSSIHKSSIRNVAP